MRWPSRPDLDWLIWPCTVEEFVATTWQRRPRVVTTDRTRGVDELFTSVELEELIEVAQPQPPSIRLAAQGLPAVGVPTTASGRIDLGQLRARFLDGYTIIVNNVQRYHPRLNALVQAVQERTSFPVEANCYFTPPGAQGFHPHYDTHDVLVVQVEGEKRWHLYGDEVWCPLHHQVDGDPFRGDELPPPEVLTLRTGDVLHIPRGWVHEAVTSSASPSLHVTLGVHAPTGRDLLRSAIDVLCRVDPELRRSLPFGYLRAGGGSSVDQLAARFATLVDLLAEHAPVAAAAALLEDDLVRRFEPTGACGLATLAGALADLRPGAVVERIGHVHARLIDAGDGVVLQFLDRLVQVPATYRDALAFVVAATRPFRVDRLPGLGPQQQVALADRLLRDGLLALAADEEVVWRRDELLAAGVGAG